MPKCSTVASSKENQPRFRKRLKVFIGLLNKLSPSPANKNRPETSPDCCLFFGSGAGHTVWSVLIVAPELFCALALQLTTLTFGLGLAPLLQNRPWAENMYKLG